METLAQRLTALREQEQWNKTFVANKLGVKLGTYANWEYGTRIPDLETIKQLAKLFDVSIDYLVGETNKKNWQLTEQEEKDIAKQIENIINQTENEADINFYGEPITKEDRGLLANALEIGLRLSKETAKKNALKNNKLNKKED